MNTSASSGDNSILDLNILFEVGGRIFDKSSMSAFIYENELNRRPQGSFILKDSGSMLASGLESGSHGVLYFTNTADETKEKAMAMSIYLTSVETIDKTNLTYFYKISFLAGSLNQMAVRTGDMISQSNSVDALRKICEVRKSSVIPFSGTQKPSDTMNWILVHQDLWSQMDSVVSRSFLPNDYVFWIWDDVNSSFKISSLLNERKSPDTHVFYKNMDSLNATSKAKDFLESSGKILWSYSSYKKSNQMGSVYPRLFPNVSFLGTPSGSIQSGGIRKKNFVDLLKAVKDDKIDDVLAQGGFTDLTAPVYGELQIKKQSLNGHDMYAFSDVYRDYKLATYSKVFVCQIYNSVGPSLGTFVTVINTESTPEGGLEIDKRFSDKYLILKKKVEYLGKARTKNGQDIDAKTNILTTLIMVSDNYGDGTLHVDTAQRAINQ